MWLGSYSFKLDYQHSMKRCENCGERCESRCACNNRKLGDSIIEKLRKRIIPHADSDVRARAFCAASSNHPGCGIERDPTSEARIFRSRQRTTAIAQHQALSQFEQFRFALSDGDGATTLRLDSASAHHVFKTPRNCGNSVRRFAQRPRQDDGMYNLSKAAAPGLHSATRTRHTAWQINSRRCFRADRKSHRDLLQHGRIECVHVTWGACPAAGPKATREGLLTPHFSRTHRGNYSGRRKIYLHNLAAGWITMPPSGLHSRRKGQIRSRSRSGYAAAWSSIGGARGR